MTTASSLFGVDLRDVKKVNVAKTLFIVLLVFAAFTTYLQVKQCNCGCNLTCKPFSLADLLNKLIQSLMNIFELPLRILNIIFSLPVLSIIRDAFLWAYSVLVHFVTLIYNAVAEIVMNLINFISVWVSYISNSVAYVFNHLGSYVAAFVNAIATGIARVHQFFLTIVSSVWNGLVAVLTFVLNLPGIRHLKDLVFWILRKVIGVDMLKFLAAIYQAVVVPLDRWLQYVIRIEFTRLTLVVVSTFVGACLWINQRTPIFPFSMHFGARKSQKFAVVYKTVSRHQGGQF